MVLVLGVFALVSGAVMSVVVVVVVVGGELGGELSGEGASVAHRRKRGRRFKDFSASS
jgi:hypothetical protein